MASFTLTTSTIDPQCLRGAVVDPACGAEVSFEGWVRNHHGGRAVSALRYEAFEALALREGGRVLAEAHDRFPGTRIACVHRLGELSVGELAVLVAASAAHREQAFAACRFTIDAIKQRVPIWKHEHYLDGTAAWVDGCHPAPAHPGADRRP